MDRKYSWCCVDGCNKTSEANPECTFNPLPEDTDRQQEWLTVIGRSDLLIEPHVNPQKFHVCSSHFEDEDLKFTTVLFPDALPNQHLPGRSIHDKPRDIKTKTVFKWGTDLKPLENKNDQPQNDVPLGLQDELTRNMHKLMKDQTILHKDRNSKDFLFYALNLYLLNPQTYCFIRESLNLPSEKVLRKMKLNLSPKLDNIVLDCLSSKLKSLPDKAKYCTVCIETLNLKNNVYYDILNDELVGLQNVNGIKNNVAAGVVFVVMLRSILVKWDQPVSYCFVKSVNNITQLEPWVDGIITSLLKIGFEVLALVTNQGRCFKKYATNIKHITPQTHYFTVNNKKIYYIFDVPQLLNCMRNNLGTKDIRYNDKTVSWQYIESLFRLENKKAHKIIPKIISGHVTLSYVTKLQSVRHAAEIFSNTVATAIHAYVDTKELPEEARETAEFCLFLNNLFDVLNSSTYKHENVYKSALGTKESQMKLLQEAVNVFSTAQWKIAEHKKEKIKGGNTKTPNPRTAFLYMQVTLNSIISIAQNLNQLGYKFLLTKRLNLEPLQSFIDLVKPTSLRAMEANNPTAIQFSRNYSKQFLKYIVTKSPLSNRPIAFQKYFEDATKLKRCTISNISSKSLILLGKGETDYRIQLPENHPTIYVASYIFYKCQEAHSCDVLDRYASTLPDLANTTCKAYDMYNRQASFHGKLKLLNYTFITYIEQLELAFTRAFNKGVRSIPEHPGSQAFNTMRYIPFPVPPCRCFPKIYAVKLLIRLRIYASIKAYNSRIRRQDINLCEFLSELRSLLESIE